MEICHLAFKMYSTYFALIFTYMVFTLPYAILMMTGYFNTLPKEIDEADPCRRTTVAAD